MFEGKNMKGLETCNC